jgi:hypothetical protein
VALLAEGYIDPKISDIKIIVHFILISAGRVQLLDNGIIKKNKQREKNILYSLTKTAAINSKINSSSSVSFFCPRIFFFKYLLQCL